MIAFFLFAALVVFALVSFWFGLRLLADCANLKATLPDRRNAFALLAIGLILLTEAYYRCPFKLVPL